MQNELRVIEFKIGESSCALPVEVVGEILNPPPLTTDPDMAAWQLGNADIRGHVAMIWHAALLTGTPGSKASVHARVLMLSDVVGIWVDEVIGMGSYNLDAVTKMKTPGVPGKSEIQVIHAGNRALWLLSKEELYQLAEERLSVL